MIPITHENLKENINYYNSIFKYDLSSQLKVLKKLKNIDYFEDSLLNNVNEPSKISDDSANIIPKFSQSNISKMDFYEKLKLNLTNNLNIIYEKQIYNLGLNNEALDMSFLLKSLETKFNFSKKNLDEILALYHANDEQINNNYMKSNLNGNYFDDEMNDMNIQNNKMAYDNMLKAFKSINKIEKNLIPVYETLEKIKVIMEFKKKILLLDKQISDVLEGAINMINTIKVENENKNNFQFEAMALLKSPNNINNVMNGNLKEGTDEMQKKSINLEKAKFCLLNKNANHKSSKRNKSFSNNINCGSNVNANNKINTSKVKKNEKDGNNKLNNSKEYSRNLNSNTNILDDIKTITETDELPSNIKDNEGNLKDIDHTKPNPLKIMSRKDNLSSNSENRNENSFSKVGMLMRKYFSNIVDCSVTTSWQNENLINRLSSMINMTQYVYTHLNSNQTIIGLQVFREGIIGRNTIYRTPFGESIGFYADDTASGRPHRIVEDYIQSILPLYANTHSDNSYFAVTFNALYHQSQKFLLNFFNAPAEVYSIIPAGNGVTGAVYRFQEILHVKYPDVLTNNIIQLKKRNDQISNRENLDELPIAILTEYEHHSNILSWEKWGFQVVPINATAKADWTQGLIDLKEKLKKLTNRPLIVVSTSAASNITSQFSPLDEISLIIQEFKENNANFLGKLIWSVDIAAYASHKKIDIGKLKMDAVFVSPHKLTGGPSSSGLLIFNNKFYACDEDPTQPGGGTVDGVYGYTRKEIIYSSNIATRETPGTPGIIQFIRAAATFQLLDNVGFSLIDEREHILAKKVFNRIREMNAIWQSQGKKIMIDILGPQDFNLRLSVFSVIFYDQNGNKLPYQFAHRLMSDLFGIQLRSGCNCAGPFGVELLKLEEQEINFIADKIREGDLTVKPGWVRFNVHFSFTDEDIDYLIYCLRFVAEQGNLIMNKIYSRNVDGSYSIKLDFSLELLFNNNHNNSDNDINSLNRDYTSDKNEKSKIHKIDRQASLHYVYDHLNLNVFDPFQVKEIHESQRNEYMKKRINIANAIIEFINKMNRKY